MERLSSTKTRNLSKSGRSYPCYLCLSKDNRLNSIASPIWPDSQTFWRDKRVTVTGGAGFLGCIVVEKLRERGATEIFVPHKRDYDPSARFHFDKVQYKRQAQPSGSGQV